MITPGPWEWRDWTWKKPAVLDNDSFGGLISDNRVIVLRGIWCNDDSADVGVSPDDARLIANAPTMLDAIVDALNDFEEHGLHAKECDCTYCNGIARLREAYKKATGQ